MKIAITYMVVIIFVIYPQNDKLNLRFKTKILKFLGIQSTSATDIDEAVWGNLI